MDWQAVLKLIQDAFAEWQRDRAAILAAALAYYTAFSLAPVLVIVIAVVSFVFGADAAQGEIAAKLSDLIGVNSANFVLSIVEGVRKPQTGWLSTSLSIGVLIFSATIIFNQLQVCLNLIWHVRRPPRQSLWAIVLHRVMSFAMVLGISVLLVLSMLLSTLLAIVSNLLSATLPPIVIFWRLVDVVLSFCLVTFSFGMIYKFLPDARIAWSDVWIGALITSALSSLGKYLLGFYLAQFGFGSVFGAASSFVVILFWVYYSTQILLFGAELTKVYANRYGSQIVPDHR